MQLKSSERISRDEIQDVIDLVKQNAAAGSEAGAGASLAVSYHPDQIIKALMTSHEPEAWRVSLSAATCGSSSVAYPDGNPEGAVPPPLSPRSEYSSTLSSDLSWTTLQSASGDPVSSASRPPRPPALQSSALEGDRHKLGPILMQLVTTMFQKIDTDVSQTISLSEARTFWGKNFASINARAMFSEVDTDGDKEITLEVYAPQPHIALPPPPPLRALHILLQLCYLLNLHPPAPLAPPPHALNHSTRNAYRDRHHPIHSLQGVKSYTILSALRRASLASMVQEWISFWQNVKASGYGESEIVDEIQSMMEGSSWVDSQGNPIAKSNTRGACCGELQSQPSLHDVIVTVLHTVADERRIEEWQTPHASAPSGAPQG